MKNRVIRGTAEDKRQLAKHFDVSNRVVQYALNFCGGSILQRAIRAYAVNYMGLPTMEMKKYMI